MDVSSATLVPFDVPARPSSVETRTSLVADQPQRDWLDPRDMARIPRAESRANIPPAHASRGANALVQRMRPAAAPFQTMRLDTCAPSFECVSFGRPPLTPSAEISPQARPKVRLQATHNATSRYRRTDAQQPVHTQDAAHKRAPTRPRRNCFARLFIPFFQLLTEHQHTTRWNY